MDWSSLPEHVALAQAAPPGFDPSVLWTQGPLGVLAAFMFYLWRRSEDRLDKATEAHKVEVAAERKLNAEQQDKRIDDHKVLLPLAQSMTQLSERMLNEKKQ